MIVACIKGGLGNQLFCYSAARRLAAVNGTELVIDHVSGFANDTAYQRRFQLDHFNVTVRKASRKERMEPLGRYRRAIRRKLDSHRPFEKRKYLFQEGVDFDPRLLELKVNDRIYLDGYWQSEKYFKDYETVIRSDLKIIPPIDTINQKMAAEIKGNNSVAIHVRWFNAPGKAGVNNADEGYYRRAVKLMEEKTTLPNYYLFSDDPDAARERIGLPADRVTVVSHNKGDDNAYADLWLMTQCKHYITANSTFSWWGAWLSPNENKIVIAPGFELREGIAWWGFKGLIPDGWIKC